MFDCLAWPHVCAAPGDVGEGWMVGRATRKCLRTGPGQLGPSGGPGPIRPAPGSSPARMPDLDEPPPAPLSALLLLLLLLLLLRQSTQMPQNNAWKIQSVPVYVTLAKNSVNVY